MKTLMRITNYVSVYQATIAIAHSLDSGEIIKSRKKFKDEIENYFSLYGLMAIDDHDTECNNSIESAKTIIEKYWNP